MPSIAVSFLKIVSKETVKIMPDVQVLQPTCRFLNFVRFLFFADFVTSCTLWLAAGDSEYLEKNVTDFKKDMSVFDIAVMRAVAAVLLAILYTALEEHAVKRATGESDSNKLTNKLWWALALLLSAFTLAYSIAKFILMHNKYQNNKKSMHVTYYALAISSLVFSAVEFVLFFVNIVMLKKVSVRYREMGQKEEEFNIEGGNGKKKKKKADLGRLFGLAKPVSIPYGILHIPLHFLYKMFQSGLHFL